MVSFWENIENIETGLDREHLKAAEEWDAGIEHSLDLNDEPEDLGIVQ